MIGSALSICVGMPGGLRLRIVPRVVEADEGEGADDGCTDTEDAHAEEVAAESVGQRVPRRRVPHRPGKRRRGGLRYSAAAVCLVVGIPGGMLGLEGCQLVG